LALALALADCTSEFIRSDNRPEFIATELQRWRAELKIEPIYITPASPWENSFVESFHSRFRNECLSHERLWSLTEAQVVIKDFRQDWNAERPRSPLGDLSPQRFAEEKSLPIPRSIEVIPSTQVKDQHSTSSGFRDPLAD